MAIDFALLSDFGQRYHAATVAAAATIASRHGEVVREHRFPAYRDFDVRGAARRVGDDLETLLSRAEGDVAVAFVVDPFKERRNLVTLWEHEGRRVYLGHPDYGQVGELPSRPHWHLLGAVEIDKRRVVPDAEVANETRQLWDGHAAYAPGAIHAVLHGLEAVGERVDALRGLDEVRVPSASDAREAPPLREGVLIHYIGASSNRFRHLGAIIDYGDVSDWRDAAGLIEFAGTNAYRDAGVEHVVVYDGPGPYAVAKTGPVTAIAPNDQSLTLLWKQSRVTGWVIGDDIHALAQDAVDGTLRLRGGMEGIHLNGYFDVRACGCGYEAAFYAPDGNGNVRLNLNPHGLGIDWSEVSGVRVRLADGTPLGLFERRESYTPQGGDERCAILNPGGKVAMERLVPSRRSRVELFAPCASLSERLLREGVPPISTGDRAFVEFVY